MANIAKPVLSTDVKQLSQQLTLTINQIIDQLNGISSTSISKVTNAYTAPPTGTIVPYAQGDFVTNSIPTELGVAGSKYVIIGWVCTVAGAPGTWLACRSLTGN